MLFLSALLSLSIQALAYVPEYNTITVRAAEQHGRGSYLIEQDVTFRKDAETYTVKETWLVANENEMRLTVEGRGPLKNLVSGTIIYQGGARYLSDNGQSVRTQNLGEEWLEPLFHFRSSRYLRARLVNLHIAPPESLRERPALNSEGDSKWEAPGFVQLSRAGGAVAWVIGAHPPAPNTPLAWFEQDQFILRKLKSAGQVVLKADDYAKYDEGLWYPRSRSYSFGPYTVQIQTLQVKSLGKSGGADSRLKASALNPARDAVHLPDSEGLKEFYSRFR